MFLFPLAKYMSADFLYFFLVSNIFFFFLNFQQIRVKHMISQGTVDQNSFGSGYGRSNVAASGRILETNVENLLRMACDCS